MALITQTPLETWQQLEETVADILSECGMHAERGLHLELVRGGANVDVMATETVEGIVIRTICECKRWKTSVTQDVVMAFRTVVADSGAHRGYIISTNGFQSGAIAAAKSTNIDLVTFEEFQNTYFEKWIDKRVWSIENSVGSVNTYYEPIGKPGYSQLRSNDERSAYDEIWTRYLFVGLILQAFAPYMRKFSREPYPQMPFDYTMFDQQGIMVPDDVRNAKGYREFLALIERYAKIALVELRKVNPITRGLNAENIERDD